MFEDEHYLVVDKPFDVRIDGDEPDLLVTLDRLLAKHRPTMPQPVSCKQLFALTD